MKIVIDISEEEYEDVKKVGGCYYDFGKAIYYGTPLPKGHGRLGDLSKIYVELNEAQIEGTEEYKGLGEAKQMICDAPTIIKADIEKRGII